MQPCAPIRIVTRPHLRIVTSPSVEKHYIWIVTNKRFTIFFFFQFFWRGADVTLDPSKMLSGLKITLRCTASSNWHLESIRGLQMSDKGRESSYRVPQNRLSPLIPTEISPGYPRDTYRPVDTLHRPPCATTLPDTPRRKAPDSYHTHSRWIPEAMYMLSDSHQTPSRGTNVGSWKNSKTTLRTPWISREGQPELPGTLIEHLLRPFDASVRHFDIPRRIAGESKNHTGRIW